MNREHSVARLEELLARVTSRKTLPREPRSPSGVAPVVTSPTTLLAIEPEARLPEPEARLPEPEVRLPEPEAVWVTPTELGPVGLDELIEPAPRPSVLPTTRVESLPAPAPENGLRTNVLRDVHAEERESAPSPERMSRPPVSVAAMALGPERYEPAALEAVSDVVRVVAPPAVPEVPSLRALLRRSLALRPR